MEPDTSEDSVITDLPRGLCVRGQAECTVIRGRVLCEGKEFGTGEKFLIYSPTSHHAVELVPIGMDVQLKFTRTTPLNIEPVANSQLFPPIDWTKVSDLIIDGLTRSNECGFSLPAKLSEMLTKVKRGTRLMVIGGKSCGKSSVNRYIANRLLNSGHSKVYWFELDPGQPEFNVSGWINLVEILKPRVGPAFAFLRSESHFKTLSSSFISELSPGNNPSNYIDCVLNLKKKLDLLDPEIPVIFNSMGWLRHLGLKLNLDVIRLCGIELIYYLKTGTSNDLPDELNPHHLMTQNGYKEKIRSVNDKGVEIVVDKSVSTKAIQDRKTVSNINREWHARNLRDVASSIYIQPWLDSSDVNWVTFHNIGLNFCAGLPSNIFQVLNNSIVSLSQVNVLPAPDKNGFCAYSNKEEAVKSLGFGWVRHVNMAERKINIHTCAPVCDLVRLGVNCLVIGHIPLPDQISTFSSKSVEHSPYIHVRDNDNVTANKYKVTHQIRKRKAD